MSLRVKDIEVIDTDARTRGPATVKSVTDDGERCTLFYDGSVGGFGHYWVEGVKTTRLEVHTAMPNADPRYLDLHDILPDAEFNFDLDGYRKAEREVLTPALEALGYEVGAWYDGERDSWGPLSRCVRIVKDNVTKIGVYA